MPFMLTSHSIVYFLSPFIFALGTAILAFNSLCNPRDLLYSPPITSSQNDVAQHYKDDEKGAIAVSKEWTQKFAVE